MFLKFNWVILKCSVSYLAEFRNVYKFILDFKKKFLNFTSATDDSLHLLDCRLQTNS